jgi:hypothetical protein
VARTLPSRIHGPRRVLNELVRLRIKIRRAADGRAELPADLRWCHRVWDALNDLIDEGTDVLSGGTDPRDARRVRKNPDATPPSFL